ncbi:MAG TPA: glycoside hydrolase family 16 protein [Candidatus Gallibacteroides avistercoris]|uniref:Glycoside hydrolase family 16 protein n=1 Tax=Candidatus Gallibacteroides avistercoris TaxID=2840833 RepID=A0A9D1M8V9_9BACT|nr:glycoside hydrolase family 16 protein [Candidatus Gallibacteroides avistercoris]
MKIYSKKIGILAVLYLYCYSLPAQKTTCPVDKSDYQLVWQDEFDQDGTPNPDFWTYENGFVRNHEAQWYQPQNATIRDGVLVITGKRETKPNPNYRKGAANWQENRENIEYTSASVITKGLKEFQYGYFEIRARIPACRGSWPAIWLLGSTGKYGWPSCGEIDIMEYYPRNGQNLLHANACWGDDNGKSVWDSAHVPYSEFTQQDTEWASCFHVWSMDWTEKYIRLYLDGRLMNEIDLSKTINGKHGQYENPFHKPMYLLLNLAMGSSGGNIQEENLPMRYEIDYVRVYQKK